MEPTPTPVPNPAAAEPVPTPASRPIAELHRIFALQQGNRWNMARTTVEERIRRLEKLRASILAHQKVLTEAVHQDFRKHPAEFELTELFIVLQELRHTIENLEEWLTPRPVRTPLVLIGTRSETRLEAKGVVAILAPWNYPFQLTLAPVIAAVASGNCVIIRPSEKTPHTAEVMRSIINTAFDEREVALIRGGLDLADAILDLPFDHFFFTGSTRIGQKVMVKAAEHLATVTLELGGKSPAIVDETADVKAAAQRVVWGKLVNAGQTCVAPDYALVHEKVRDRFLDEARASVERAYGRTEEERRSSPDFPRMIDLPSLHRVQRLIEETVAMGARLELGGKVDPEDRYLAPTLLSGVSPSSPVMREEIFGPVLPVLTFKEIDEAFSVIHRMGKPLSLYIFSTRERNVEHILLNTSSGGVVVNNTLLHLSKPDLPFGGVGASGQGSYHGLAGIRAFSHERAVMRQGRPVTSRLFHPPYTAQTRRLIAWVMRLAG